VKIITQSACLSCFVVLSHFIHCVGIFKSPFLFFSFWVSLKIKGKKTPVLFFSFFFSFFSFASLWGHKKKKRELSEITPLKIYYFKALSIRAALP